jgi:Pvc16 N-terminal domain
MSNHLAVATVTAALQRLLQATVPVDVPGAAVTTVRPGGSQVASALAVNVYLYQVSTNGFTANNELPSRRADGSLLARSRAHLDLHYLFSFHGNDAEMEPERLLGSTVRTLNDSPVLTSALLQAVSQSAAATPPVHPGLAGTDLGAAGEIVRITPEMLDLEQLSKLWSVLLQTPYLLSTTYVASAVALEGNEIPSMVQPVITPVVATDAHGLPRIMGIADASDPAAPLTSASTMRISGGQLGGTDSTITVGGVALAPTGAGPGFLDLNLSTLPAGTIRAGLSTVSVTVPILAGSPPAVRPGAVSDPSVVALHPQLTAQFGNGILTLTTDLPVGPGQLLAVRLLDAASEQPVALLAVATPAAASLSMSVPAPTVTSGRYAVVLFVDGAASVLQRTGAGSISQPVVTVP